MVSWTGSILPANRNQRVAMLMCSHVSKNKQMNNCNQHRLNPHGRGLMVTAANNAYCVISKGNDDTYDGEIAGSHSWLNGSYLELSWGGGGGHFWRDNNTHRSQFNVSLRTGIHNLLNEFWEPWQLCCIGSGAIRRIWCYTEPCYKKSLLCQKFGPFSYKFCLLDGQWLCSLLQLIVYFLQDVILLPLAAISADRYCRRSLPSVRHPSVCPKRRSRSNSLLSSTISIKFGRMINSTMEQIAN